MTAAHTRARGAWQTPERIDALCALLEAGIPINVSCAKLGIPRRSFYDLRAADEDFDARIRDALASYEAEELERIREAAEDVSTEKGVSRGDWKARAWLLEKRFPKRYGKQAPEAERKIKITGSALEQLKAAAGVLGKVPEDDGET